MLQDQPKLELHTVDRSHPSPQGSYLAACVLYGRMFAADGNERVLVELKPEVGKRLRAAAAKVLASRSKSKSKKTGATRRK